MNKETKSIVKIASIALFALVVIFGILYAMKSGKAHRHGSGEVHSH